MEAKIDKSLLKAAYERAIRYIAECDNPKDMEFESIMEYRSVHMVSDAFCFPCEAIATHVLHTRHRLRDPRNDDQTTR